ncbi:hypothetical protein Goklo_016093, partial [Gossypium klotzschianum]|nr:hypothetical protein [Gossypium klotzschianum]
MGLVLRLTKVIIEGDPLSVITKCNSSHTDKSEVSSYIHALATECVKKGEGFYLIGLPQNPLKQLFPMIGSASLT